MFPTDAKNQTEREGGPRPGRLKKFNISRSPMLFLEDDCIPERSLLDGFGADLCASITAIQPHPFVLLRNRYEGSPSWSVCVPGIIPNNNVIWLAVAVDKIISIAG